MEGKEFWCSKTVWANLLVIAAIIAQTVSGKEILDANIQVAILGVINLVLRGITKQPILW